MSSRPSGMRGHGGGGGGGGEIVEVQGGHIVRSIGRKDRHSKVCTAKGPRDRRVRLSAHTAIQFYDVQDRLGYDRPSKAVDWLIKNAKAAIDEIAELPPWHPTATTVAAATTAFDPSPAEMGQHESAASSSFAFGGSSSFLPPSLESDPIADTVKFFFPIQSSGGGGASIGMAPASPSLAGFHQYPHETLSRSNNSHAQDLRLSLQSFQDPILLHQPAAPPAPQSGNGEQSFSDTTSDYQRFFQWGGGSGNGSRGTNAIPSIGASGSSVGPYMLNMSETLHPVLGQNPFLSQRGPLQSNSSPSVLAWTDPSSVAAAMHQAAAAMSVSHGFASSGFPGFRIPAGIQGEEEVEEADDEDEEEEEE